MIVSVVCISAKEFGHASIGVGALHCQNRSYIDIH